MSSPLFKTVIVEATPDEVLERVQGKVEGVRMKHRRVNGRSQTAVQAPVLNKYPAFMVRSFLAKHGVDILQVVNMPAFR